MYDHGLKQANQSDICQSCDSGAKLKPIRVLAGKPPLNLQYLTGELNVVIGDIFEGFCLCTCLYSGWVVILKHYWLKHEDKLISDPD